MDIKSQINTSYSTGLIYFSMSHFEFSIFHEVPTQYIYGLAQCSISNNLVRLFMFSIRILHYAAIYMHISKAWNLYASLCFESDGFGWNIKIPSSLRGERLSQIVAPFLWHCYCWELPLTLLLLAATVPVSDRPTATASCNSIAVRHFRTSLLLLFTLSSFLSLYFLSLNEFYCTWL